MGGLNVPLVLGRRADCMVLLATLNGALLWMASGSQT